MEAKDGSCNEKMITSSIHLISGYLRRGREAGRAEGDGKTGRARRTFTDKN